MESYPGSSSPISSGGFVICVLHNTRRKSGYCVTRPIYDADKRVVGVEYVCAEGSTCSTKEDSLRGDARGEVSSAARGASPKTFPPVAGVLDGSSSSVVAAGGASTAVNSQHRRSSSGQQLSTASTSLFAVTFHSTAAPDATASGAAGDGVGGGQPTSPSSLDPSHSASNSQKQGAGGGRGALRYYEPSRSGGVGVGVKKVCWHCGLPGHEKPDCPNVLCRTCHLKRPPYGIHHLCPEVCAANQNISPFVCVSKVLPQSPTGMAAVRCLSCAAMGHLDCGGSGHSSQEADQPPARAIPAIGGVSCCYCASAGHDGFSCPQRERMNPDRWVQRQLQAHSGRPSGGVGGYGNPNHREDTRHASYNENRQGGSSNNTYRQQVRQAYDQQQHGGGGGGEYSNRASPNHCNNGTRPYSGSNSHHNSYGDRRGRSDHDGGEAHYGSSGSRRQRREDTSYGHHRDISHHQSRSSRDHHHSSSGRDMQRSYGRRGGRSGCSGWSDEDQLY